MRVVYMGRKPAASEGLRYLVEKGINVVVVVAPQSIIKFTGKIGLLIQPNIMVFLLQQMRICITI